MTYDEAKNHCDKLIRKYGKDAVKGINYDSKGRINERVVSGRQIATSMAFNLINIPLAALGSPVGVVMYPKGAHAQAKAMYRTAKKNGDARKSLDSNRTKYRYFLEDLDQNRN